MNTRNAGLDNVRRRLPTSFRWIGAIGSSPESRATGDSAASHRALERGRRSRCFHCVREGEVIWRNGGERFLVFTSPWGPSEGSLVFLGRWRALGWCSLNRIKTAFYFHRGQRSGRVFQPEEEPVNSALPAWSPQANLSGGVRNTVPHATRVPPPHGTAHSLPLLPPTGDPLALRHSPWLRLAGIRGTGRG